MKKVNFIKYGLCTLMMSLALILCCSCSKDDEETVEKKRGLGLSNGHAYVELAGIKWATENVGKVDGVDAIATDKTYGYYYVYGWDDVAKKAAESWGGKWTLPTVHQWWAIAKNCDWTWKEDYSFNGKKMNGYIVSDKNDPAKFIFLPCAGWWDDTFAWEEGISFYSVGIVGYYWTSDFGRFFEFSDHGEGRPEFYSDAAWYMAILVRPVLSE